MFSNAKTQYLSVVGNTLANQILFDNFLSSIDTNQSLAASINDAIATQQLRRINIVTATQAANGERDDFNSGLISGNSNAYSRLTLATRTIGGGTLRFSASTINSSDPNSHIFVAAHENYGDSALI
jgi:hypothetical protein